ncbi:MAG: di-heme oxidoredictase family protein [Planctomycetota bacterium]
MSTPTPANLDLPRGPAVVRSYGAVCLLAVMLSGVFAIPATQALSRSEFDATVSSGGALTVDDDTSKAFGQHSPDLPLKELRSFTFGNRLFNTNWVTAPASVKSLDGLGPLFNRVSCTGCHTRDGRGRAPDGPDEMMISMLVRLSVPDQDGDGQPDPHPVYGGQLNDRAVLGVDPEGRAAVSWIEVPGQYPDGTPYTLRQPSYQFVDLAYGPLGEEVMFSPRVANAVFGLGLLETVPEQDILARADPDDRDGDGISGRANWVRNVETGELALGRFGWKANQPSLRQQAASAIAGDIGITNALFPNGSATPSQTHARAQPNGNDQEGVELSQRQLDKLTFYLQQLAVPAARNTDTPEFAQGQMLFAAVGCNACHTPQMTTGPNAAHALLSNQTFMPYTDLLLHDMGEALADHRPDGEATGREWRTPPLWGLGLQERVNGHTHLIHDGRARNLEEAILWHGGEADASRNRFMELTADERKVLLYFLNSI